MKITCKFCRLIFESDDGNYKCILMTTKEEDKLPEGVSTTFFVNGKNLPIDNFNDYIIEGDWIKHQKYGMQFSCTSYEMVPPVSRKDFVKFLSMLVAGVGKKTADKIYDTFGEDTFNVLETDIDRLSEVKGVPEKKLLAIKEEYTQNSSMRKVNTFLKKYGVFLDQKSIDLIGNTPEQVLRLLKTRPFILKNFNVPFMTCNKMASDIMETEPENAEIAKEQRIFNGIFFVLNSVIYSQGNVYEEINKLLQVTEATINSCSSSSTRISIEDILVVLRKLYRDGVVKFEESNGRKLLFSETRWTQETAIAKFCAEYSKYGIKPADELLNKINEQISSAELYYGFEASENQKEAVRMAVLNRLLVVTGGAGTGKTTVLKLILYVLKALYPNEQIALTAPTGRASRRIAQVTNKPACTIHSLLALRPEDDECRELECSTLIIDEFSMVDMELFHKVIENRGDCRRFILIGDYNQLPSVGGGNVLFDLIHSKCVPVIKLDTIYRQLEQSSIVYNATCILNGRSNLKLDKDFGFIPETTDTILDKIKKVFLYELKYNSLDEVQIISPTKTNHTVCTKAINEALQPLIVNTNEKGIFTNGYTLYVGDKVIQQVNTDEVKNGDIGYVQAIYEKDGLTVCQILFDEKLVEYTKKELTDNKVVLAYAITVHKSQGSEFSTVIMVSSFQQKSMLRRNLVYTAVTRAKNKFILVGEKDAFKYAIGNNDIPLRQTRLAERTAYYFKKKSH